MDTDDSLTPGEENLIDTDTVSHLVRVETNLGSVRYSNQCDV